MNRESENVEALEVEELDAERQEATSEAEAASTAVDSEVDYDVDQHVQELEQNLAEAETKVAEYLDGWQRARADYANTRKRLERERADAYSNAAIDYAKKVLPVIDDFDRAMANVPENVEQDTWFEGILLVSRKMHAILKELHVEPIEAVGQPFDPNYHEALSLKEEEGIESGMVIEEIQAGYRLGERVIRPALVNVVA